MPIIDVEIVTQRGEHLPPALAAALADALGEAYGAGPGRVWVRLRDLPAERYAENGGGEPVFPVFVTLREGAPPAPEALAAHVARIAACVARAAGRPVENVHVIVEPAMKGRVAFGGKLVT
jgi:phenylpyruvate tautomerase PptA (4-oxalocrotonate tautomerase family)